MKKPRLIKNKPPKLKRVQSISVLLIALCLLVIDKAGIGQNNTPKLSANPSVIDSISTKTIAKIEKQYASIKNCLLGSSEKTLKRLRRKEEKLQKKLARKDSAAAKQLFSSGAEQYDRLLQKINDPQAKLKNTLKNYVPGLDSVQTMFKWIDQPGRSLSGIGSDKLEQIKSASSQITSLQSQLQSATDIKEVIKQRKAQLQAEFDKLGLSKELSSFKKEAYYYQQQINEYKQLLNSPDKLIEKALSFARNTPAFKEFFSRNSFLAQLFPVPNGYGTAQALQGLQTRSGVQQQLSQQLGAGANPQQYMQQQMQQAQSQLNTLKDKINTMGGGSSDLEMPDFKPNTQRTKSFWKRIEYGFNMQSQKTNALLPVTSDIAITGGYKLNDKSVIGVGVGYKLGWGKDISHIRISSEGISLRSYLDIKLKGSIWISGAYEYNYQQAFGSIEQLKDLNAWQKSGLIGLTKKYKVGKKNGNLQLLWDFLSYSQVPKTQALKFRIGYTF